MGCGNPSWLVYATDAVLFIAALLCVDVMQKADKDQQIRRIDSRWLRNLRRISFIAVAMFAFMLILTDISLLSVFFLVLAAAVLLAIDDIALRQRPPHDGLRTALAGNHAIVRALAPVRYLLSVFRRSGGITK